MKKVEFHTGKLYPVKLEGTLEETCKYIAKRFGYELSENWIFEFVEKFNHSNFSKGYVTEEYFVYKDSLYRVIDHEERDDRDYYMDISRNSNGSLSFKGRLINEENCFYSALENALDNIKPSYQEEIKNIADEIVRETGVDRPKTVMGVGLIILKNKGFDEFKRLFTGAIKETEDDVFKGSAYAATLEFIENQELNNEKDRN